MLNTDEISNSSQARGQPGREPDAITPALLISSKSSRRMAPNELTVGTVNWPRAPPRSHAPKRFRREHPHCPPRRQQSPENTKQEGRAHHRDDQPDTRLE